MKPFFFLPIFAVAVASSAWSAPDHVFVQEGAPTSLVIFRGDSWEAKNGALVGGGEGRVLAGGVEFLQGDFSIRARLRITGLRQSAASFMLGESHFGFEGRTGEMFIEGPLFGALSGATSLGAPVVKDGEAFDFSAVRERGVLVIKIDDREVVKVSQAERESLSFGLRPHRATMHLEFLAASGSTRDLPKPLPHTTVFRRGVGGYHTYRIPAAVLTRKGTLLAFCEGRKEGRGDAGNIDLLLRRSTDAGTTWSEPILIWDDGGNTCGNPCPVVDQETGTIWLLLTWNLGSDHESEIMKGHSAQPRHVYVSHSDDDGLTWAAPMKISETARKDHWRWYATGPGNAIQLSRGIYKGRLLIPCNHSDHSDPGKHPYRSHVLFSDDHGKSWKIGGVHEDKTNESAVVELSDGSLLQAMRSYHGKNLRAMATSADGGESWSKVRLDGALDTPVCQANILRYSWPEDQALGSKSRILFSSPQGRDRSRMTVWMSHDEGKTWPVRKLVHEGGSAYSNLVVLPDGKVGLLYEKDGYASISFTTFPIEWLTGDEE